MKVIKLPSSLPGDLDIEEVNRGLRAGEARLDWSDVRDAAPDALHRLLRGLDLVEHSEILGTSTVPDELSDRIAEALERGEAEAEDEGPAVEKGVEEGKGGEEGEGNAPVLVPKTPYEVREELEDLVLKELLGPA